MSKKKTLLAVSAVILLVAILVGAWLLLRPGTAAGEKQIRVEVEHLDGTEKTFTVQTAEEYLGPALEKEGLISGTPSEYGLFIDTVDGEYADADQGQWWVFTVNGEMGEYGADSQPIADGDVYSFSVYVG